MVRGVAACLLGLWFDRDGRRSDITLVVFAAVVASCVTAVLANYLVGKRSLYLPLLLIVVKISVRCVCFVLQLLIVRNMYILTWGFPSCSICGDAYGNGDLLLSAEDLGVVSCSM